jgi:hypothetical protein
MQAALITDPNPTYVPAAVAVTPDITALATALDKDPVKIYEWVRNNVRTEFYVGCVRGAHLTLVELAGNDVDQCTLLGALLNAAGYTPNYKSGRLTIPRTATGNNQVGVYQWVGVTVDAPATNILYPYNPVWTGSNMAIDQMWVSVVAGGRTLVFAPSVKPYTVGRLPDIATLASYTLAAARTGANANTAGAQSPAISASGLRSYLTARATTASNSIGTSATNHNMDGPELSHLRVIVPELVSVTSPTATNFPANLTYDPSAATYTGIPSTYCAILQVNVGHASTPGVYQLSFSAFTSVASDKRIELTFAANGIATITLGGVNDGSQNSAPASTSDPVVVYWGYTLPLAYYNNQNYTVGGYGTMPRSAPIELIYSYGRTLGRLQALNATLAQASITNSVTDSDRMQLMGLQYASQVNELGNLASASLDCEYEMSYLLAFTYLQGGKPVLNTPTVGVLVPCRNVISASNQIAVDRMLSVLIGGLEGTIVEQIATSRGYGTPTLFDASADAGYILDSTNINSPPSGISNFNDATFGTGVIQSFKNFVNISGSGNKIFILKNSKRTINSVNYAGAYLIAGNDVGYAATMIRGNFGGVTGGTFKTTVGNGSDSATAETRDTLTKPSVTQTKSKDPVDLTNGAFVKTDVDLVVGNDAEPNGLHLVRNYNSARSLLDPTGLGRGWTHNYDLRLSTRTPGDFDMLRSSVDEVLPVVVAARLIRDTMDTGTPYVSEARGWLMSSTAATWAVDRQINSRASVTMGDRVMEFVIRPDNTYAAPGCITATLTKQADGTAVQNRWTNRERHRLRVTPCVFSEGVLFGLERRPLLSNKSAILKTRFSWRTCSFLLSDIRYRFLFWTVVGRWIDGPRVPQWQHHQISCDRWQVYEHQGSIRQRSERDV